MQQTFGIEAQLFVDQSPAAARDIGQLGCQLSEYRCSFREIAVCRCALQQRGCHRLPSLVDELQGKVVHRRFATMLGNVFGRDCASERAFRTNGSSSGTNAVLIAISHIDRGVPIKHVGCSLPPLKREPRSPGIAIHCRQIGNCSEIAQFRGLTVPADSLFEITPNAESNVISIAK